MNRNHVSNSGPTLSLSPISSTKSPGRLWRSTAINCGSRPDAKVFRPIFSSKSALIGMRYFNVPRVSRNSFVLCATYCAGIHLSGLVQLNSSSDAGGTPNSACSQTAARDGVGTNFNIGGTGTFTSGSHASGFDVYMGVMADNSHGHISCNFISTFFRSAVGCWGLHKILRASRPIPRLGPDVFESTLVVVPASVRMLPGESSSATCVEGLGYRETWSRSRS